MYRFRSVIAFYCLLICSFLVPAAKGLCTIGKRPAATSVERVTKPWQGDLQGMIKRHSIRVQVVYNPPYFFFDKGRPQGLTYEMLRQFEKYINTRYRPEKIKTAMIFLSTSPDRLLPDLLAGRGDIAAANLTITPKRREEVDFSDPFLSEVSQIVVTGPGERKLSDLDSLAGRKVYVRGASGYTTTLRRLNAIFARRGKPPVRVVRIDKNLEDRDVLDMVNAGLIPMTIVDNYEAELWARVFRHITLYPDIAVKTGGKIGWAVRKDNPHLLAEINAFMKTHKQGTRMGNILIDKYLKHANYVQDALTANAVTRFDKTFRLVKEYARRYHLDWIFVMALAFQESKLDQHRRGPLGGIGIMQVKPSIAALPAIHVGHISKLENNIHAGTKYLRYVIQKFFADKRIDRLNKILFACAAYNAGPTEISALRKKAAAAGVDPNRWFGNVEVVAAEDIGSITVQYVRNIYKYAVAYSLYVKQLKQREQSKRSLKSAPSLR